MAKTQFEALINFGGKLDESLRKSTEDVKKGLEGISEQSKKAVESLDHLKESLVGVGAAWLGLQGMEDFFGSALEQGEELIGQQARLKVALEGNADFFHKQSGWIDEQSDSLERFAKQQEKLGMFKSKTMEALTLVETLAHVDSVAAKTLVSGVDNLEARLGHYNTDITDVMRKLVEGIHSGEVGKVFKELGVSVTKVQEKELKSLATDQLRYEYVVKILEATNKYNSALEGSPLLKMMELQAHWHDFTENFGASMIEVLGPVSKMVDTMLGSESGDDPFDVVVQKVKGAGESLNNWVNSEWAPMWHGFVSTWDSEVIPQFSRMGVDIQKLWHALLTGDTHWEPGKDLAQKADSSYQALQEQFIGGARNKFDDTESAFSKLLGNDPSEAGRDAGKKLADGLSGVNDLLEHSVSDFSELHNDIVSVGSAFQTLYPAVLGLADFLTVHFGLPRSVESHDLESLHSDEYDHSNWTNRLKPVNDALQSFLFTGDTPPDQFKNFPVPGVSPGFNYVPGDDTSLGGLPHLAGGGLVNSPLLGVIGEAGPELVLPLADLPKDPRLTQAFIDLPDILDKISDRLGGGYGNSGGGGGYGTGNQGPELVGTPYQGHGPSRGGSLGSDSYSTSGDDFHPDTSGSRRINAIFNNPGALGLSDLGRRFGATASGKFDAGHPFAAFPTKEAGAAAQFALWESRKNYLNHTLKDAIGTWTGVGDSGEDTYISKHAGIPLNQVITDDFLKSPQGIKLMQAQAQYEGQNVLTQEQWQAGQDWAYNGIRPRGGNTINHGDTVINYSPTIHATDAKGVSNVLEKHKQDLSDILDEHYREIRRQAFGVTG
jgi:hypothetical protein